MNSVKYDFIFQFIYREKARDAWASHDNIIMKATYFKDIFLFNFTFINMVL